MRPVAKPQPTLNPFLPWNPSRGKMPRGDGGCTPSRKMDKVAETNSLTRPSQSFRHRAEPSAAAQAPLRARHGLDKVLRSWSLYRGEHKLPLSSYPFLVLHLQSRATQEEIARVAKGISDKTELYVVYNSSLQNWTEFLNKTFGSSAKTIKSTKDFLTTFIKGELARYISEIKKQTPKYYINPPVGTPSGFARKIPNPLLNFLKDVDPSQRGAVVVLLAEPGQGKTYMSRYLGSTLAARSDAYDELIPISIDSTQWQLLSLDDLGSLYKTITNSFKHYSTPISWIDGCRGASFSKLALKAGMFRIIFDGFDEYVLKNKGAVAPREVLDQLTKLAEITDARIVITCRTSFWELNFSDPKHQNITKRCLLFLSIRYVHSIVNTQAPTLKSDCTTQRERRKRLEYSRRFRARIGTLLEGVSF